MKFKKLEIAGFKSFADRLEVKFGAGVTAIVGPNGCGKSNVADSIRWVLGEQSAKLLRGNSMQDVIFNGTDKRKSLSYCEVNLYFDNTDKQLFPTLEYDEVVISRKLYRSGESEYCLNRTPCRLKDITELLRDGGMGREGYSIIGQGRIEELLRAKPEDRRAIFEEAAGISKFKARKLEAERRLARTRENMQRVQDIMHERSEALGPVTKQAEAATKWLELRDKLKSHEINIYIHQYDTASQAKAAIQSRLDGVKEEIILRQNECDQATAAYNEAMENLGNADKAIGALNTELVECEVGLERLSGNINLLKERLRYLTTQNATLYEEKENCTREHAEALKSVEQLRQKIQTLEVELQDARVNSQQCDKEYLDIVDTIARGEGEAESNHRAVIEAMDKLTEIRSNMSRLTAEREGLASKLEDLTGRIAIAEQKLADGKGHTVRLRAETEEKTANKEELIKKLSELNAINDECASDIGAAAENIDKISQKYYNAKSRYKIITEMKESYEGFAYSIKKLATEAKQRADIRDRMEGVVASLLTVKPGYETAIETALGNAVQNVVTRTEEDAKYLIEFLKATRSGRATFLPMSSVKPRSLEPEYGKFLSEKGVCGIASNLTSFDAKYSNIFEGLLGNTVIVEDMDCAIALARKSRYGFKIVTKEGEVISPHGSITGGSKKSDITNVFGYEREIEELSSAISQMDSDLNKYNAIRNERAAVKNETVAKINSLGSILHGLELEIATRNEALSKFEAADLELEEDLNALNAEKSAATERITAITSDFDSVGELEQIVRGKRESANVNEEERRREFDALRRLRDELHDKMTVARVKISETEGALEAANNNLIYLNSSVESYATRMEYAAEQIEENNKLISQLDADITSAVTSGGAHDSARVKEIRAKLSDLGGYKEELNERLAAFDKRRMDCVDALQKLHDRKSSEELQLLKVDTDIEQMQEKIKTDYEMEYADCVPFKIEGYDINKGIAEANRLTRQMHALGSVNVGAIEQAQEMFARYHEMELQHDDLSRAEADIVKIISDLSAEMLDKFTDRFEKIRVNFIKIFKELFDGGSADLLLLDADNPLDAGIEIVAQPPEKKLQSISLLSGGERALTAIAILFAILRLKPMPFCVLDEIEAALDDANAGRFAKYLRRFSEETQFIVITHRKPTMELADSLYGVTMEEKGVSKIVSVKLSEAMALEEKE